MELHPAVKCRKDWGNISAMTYWRWIKLHGFPAPVKINGRNYHTRQQITQDIPEWFERKFAE
jgi:predicted DNA-binding transcriptional regulator AlpA